MATGVYRHADPGRHSDFSIAMNQLHLPSIRLVQNRIIQHQYSRAHLDLRFHLKPKGIAGRFKPLVEPTIGIMGRLAEANGIGSLGLHRCRIHQRGGQEVDEVFI